MELLQITPSNKSIILELFNKEIDEKGFIIEKKTKKRLKCPYSKQAIHSEDFSILPGSAIFVNNLAYCFAEHITTHS